MSDAIYDDVIRNESDRMEMMVDIYESTDCVRDHNFRTETNTHQPLQRTGSDCVKIRSYRAAVVCLVLLCVLLLTAVIVLCVHIHTNNTNYTQERDELLTNITNLNEERDELLTKITNLKEERDQLLTNITNLNEERDELLTKITNLTEERDNLITSYTNLIKLNKKLQKNELWNCFNEMDGWFYYQYSFYYISSEKKSWKESRRYCTERGADLIIIDNRGEQSFVAEKTDISEVWIGLTDIDEEGTWKWVDGSKLTSGFWASKEPNGGRAENCAVSFSSRLYGYSSRYHKWNDSSCNYVSKWICEKNILK